MGVMQITYQSDRPSASEVGFARTHRGARQWRRLRLSRVLSGGAIVAVVSVGVGAVAPAPAPLLTSSAAIRLLDTVIGVGPSFDGFGASLPLFFYGTTIPAGDTFYTVPYPASINLGYPIISSLPILSSIPYWPETLKRSEEVGAGYLEQAIAGEPVGEKLTILGMSQGTQVGEIARADMAKNATYVANAQDYSFEFIGDPYQPNGGILSRFTALANLPILGDLFPLGRPGPSDSPFKTTYYQNQYDGFADFPEYLNPLAIVNALLGIVFEHVLPGYVFESSSAPNDVTTTVGNTTYVTIPQYLPLLTPLRLAASLFGAQRFVNAFDPILRVFVEMGYDRTADPSQVAQFSLFTPLQKIVQGLQQVPAAIAEGLRILAGAPYTPTLPQPVVSTTEPTTPVTVHPALPVDTSPLAKAVRSVVVKLSAALTNLTEPLAKLLQIIGGKTSPGPVAATNTTNTTKTAVATTPTEQANGSRSTAVAGTATPGVAGATTATAAPPASLAKKSQRPSAATTSIDRHQRGEVKKAGTPSAATAADDTVDHESHGAERNSKSTAPGAGAGTSSRSTGSGKADHGK